MITIVDYGVGNILALLNIYKRLNVPVNIAKTVDDLVQASHLILPGVGTFDHAMRALQQSGMREMLDDLVLAKQIPVLGICVGMQLLAARSDEGVMQGLNWIPGSVRLFHQQESSRRLILPHMGWNNIRPIKSSALLDGLEQDPCFYFLHSYYFACENKMHVLAESDYGSLFSCAVSLNNIYGVQFHPEKSHHYGIRLLKNFAEIAAC
jgi:glutamine amidotransferase